MNNTTNHGLTINCLHCESSGICTPATRVAHWVDADGQESAEAASICDECLGAGSPSGPGYREDIYTLAADYTRNGLAAQDVVDGLEARGWTDVMDFTVGDGELTIYASNGKAPESLSGCEISNLGSATVEDCGAEVVCSRWRLVW